MKPAPSALPDFLNELRPRISGDLRTDDYNKVLYSTDSSIFQVMPFGVLMPKTMEDVHAAVELAAKYRIPLLPRTGGSSLAGQAVNAALVVDFTKHLDDILEINPEEQWVRVQPGRVLDELNIELAPHGKGTRLTLTEDNAFLTGKDENAGRTEGWAWGLGRLDEELNRQRLS